MGRTRLATFLQLYTCRVPPERDTQGRGSAVTFQSCQFKENTRIKSALCLKTMPRFVTVHTFCASRDGSRNQTRYRGAGVHRVRSHPSPHRPQRSAF